MVTEGIIMKQHILSALLGAALLIAGCTTSETVQTSKNTAIVQTSAAPVCGGGGAMKAGYKHAAIATINAGFDSFIITNGSSADNVRMVYTGYGFTEAGSHDQAFSVRMFHQGEAGSGDAISAREVLGPKWQEIVKKGMVTCS
jgi:hypothetical protein